jgi:hypothetical protein
MNNNDEIYLNDCCNGRRENEETSKIQASLQTKKILM